MSVDHPTPTDHARELVIGGYDTHVHVAPDVMERRIDDVTLARRFAEVGLAGFVLKSHYVPTAERAEVVRGVVPGVEAFGALTLNGSVGGLNPVAVEIAGRQGARVVWLPTVDCANERAGLSSMPPGATRPMWAALQDELAEQGIVAPPIEVVDEAGKVVPALHEVLAVLAKHDMVLATGHLSGPEIVAAVDAAAGAGVRRIIVTHPEFTSQQLDVDTQRHLAGRGALLERCFTTAYTGKVSWELLFEHIREVGPEHSLLSSDLGQPFNPPVEDGLALLADRLLGAGFSDDEVRTMAVTNTRRVLGR
ncbi:DUF6282 family protein [Actinoplanes regularis]|uniref:DUF6282 family protein n=1 Tax=Actinoplanes regularis TaxID=52697 RepID=UPI0025578B55|nr:DUF6282 family protein [Actinoplanes regularis]GLW27883.1 hypothetical protein Areg01_08230 [Actinoplanes regularis]